MIYVISDIHGCYKEFLEMLRLIDFSAKDDLFVLGDVVDRGKDPMQYYENRFLVTGHTPTFLINEEYRGKIYRKLNHIALDCGSVFGENLGCICLRKNTM